MVGVTTNPSIFQKAISGADAYVAQVEDLATRGVDVGEALRLITTSDVRWGCDVLRPAYDASDTVDGRVSIEVDPRISKACADKTIAEARSLWWMVDRPNLYIKIPATLGSLSGHQPGARRGHQRQRHADLLPRAVQPWSSTRSSTASSGPARPASTSAAIGSVASFFVSRVDTEIDKRLDKLGTDEAKALKGKAAVANARLAYQLYEEKFGGERWAALAAVRRQGPAPAVGLDRRQGPGVRRHDVRRRPGGRPRRSTRCPSRRCRRSTTTASSRATASAATTSTRRRCSTSWPASASPTTTSWTCSRREGVDKFEQSWTELIEAVEAKLNEKKSS